MVAQFMAISLFLLAFSYLFNSEENKNNRVVAYTLCAYAATVHSSGLVFMVVMIGLDFLRISKKTLIMLSIGLPTIGLLLHGVLTKLLTRVVDSTRFSGYIGSYFQGQTSYSTLIIETAVVIFMILTLIVYNSESELFHYKFLFFESIALFLIIFQFSLPLMYRMAFYFASCHILTIPRFLSLIKINYLRRTVSIGILICLAIWLWSYPISGNYDGFLPYTSYFSPFDSYE
jgi:hypothetical protein